MISIYSEISDLQNIFLALGQLLSVNETLVSEWDVLPLQLSQDWDTNLG
jgi:hypothetical protein